MYGKVFVDLAAMIRGPLDALTMRGNMNLLGNTNVTYVLTDSPLTVEDRLDELVTFTSFNDTTTVPVVEGGALSLGGMDVLLSLHIDDAVRLRADLVTDGSKYIELEGGGDLSLQYTPQGDMSLTGRYTLSGGMMKYSLPIIPLKEFKFDSGSYVDWARRPDEPHTKPESHGTLTGIGIRRRGRRSLTHGELRCVHRHTKPAVGPRPDI